MAEVDNVEQQSNKSPDRRISPSSELDLQLLVTNPVWGKPAEITRKVKSDLNKLEKKKVRAGDLIYKDGQLFKVTEDSDLQDERNLWEELSAVYTRDIRLGNLSRLSGEDAAVRYYLDLAGDFLQEGFKEPFFKCMKMAITIIETSQSVGGFLRNRQSTFTHEAINKDLSPPKRNLLGMAKTEK